jgi:hypothetical protein
MPRAHRVVEFPRVNPQTGEPIGRVAIWVLTQDERIRAAANAERATRELLGDAMPGRKSSQGAEDIYENNAACEVLFRACRDVDDLDRPAFPSVAAIKQFLSVDEVAVLLRLYTEVQAEIGPIVSHMSEGDVNAWIDRLAEAGSMVPLSLLAPTALGDLVTSMARRLSPSPTASSLVGSLSSAGARVTPPGETHG